MKEIILIRFLPDGLWEIKVLLRKNAREMIERGKRCKL
jgi:hypothetical protein